MYVCMYVCALVWSYGFLFYLMDWNLLLLLFILMLKLSQIWSLATPSSWNFKLLCPLDMGVSFFCILFTSDTTRYFRATLYFPCPSHGTKQSFKEYWCYFSRKYYLETQIWVPGVLIVPVMLFLLGSDGDKTKKNSYLCIHTHTLISSCHCNTTMLIIVFSLSIFVTLSFNHRKA